HLEVVFEDALDRVDDLVHRVRSLVCDPVRLARGAIDLLAEKEALADVVDVGHRPSVVAVADDRRFPVAHHLEEEGLAWWLTRPGEPGRSDDDGLELTRLSRSDHDVLRELLGLAIRHVRVVRSRLVEDMALRRVRPDRRVRGDVDEPANAG